MITMENNYQTDCMEQSDPSLLMTSSSISPGPPPPHGTLTSLSIALSSSCCENGRPILTDPHTGQSICSCQYGSGLLSAYSRAQGLGESMYSTPHYSTQGYMPSSTDTTAFYSPLHPAQYDTLKDTSTGETWRGIAQPTSCYPYDPMMSPYPYTNTYGGIDLNGAARRKNATRETTNTLKAWLYEHRKNPYPTKGEKIMLAIITKMTLTQVSTWFANARRRLKKENKMTWSPRNRCGDDEDDDDEEKNDDSGDSGDNESKINDNKTNIDTKNTDSEGVRERPLSKPKETKSLNNSFASSAESRLGSAVSVSLTPPSVNPQSTLVSEMNIGHDFKPFGSPSANSSDSGLSNINGSKLANGSASDQSDQLRPRIWSLAHVATSTAGLGSPVVDLKDQSANLTLGLKLSPNPISIQTPSYTSTNNSMNMRPWLDTTFNMGSSIFSPVPGSYTTLGGQRPKESLSSTVNHNFTSLNGLSSSNLSRPYPSLSNLYNPIRELTKRNMDTMTMSDLHS